MLRVLNLKILLTKRHYYKAIINGNNFYDQSINSDKEIKKVTTGQGEDYTTRCLLDHEEIKNH